MEEYTQITLDQWTQWKEDIRRKLSETASNFVYIGYRLKQIRDSGMYDGAADVFEFAEKEYNLGKSTTSRFIAINERYSEGGNSLEIKEEFRGFSSSKLAEMLTLPDNELQLITEKTTIREIRELKNFNSQAAKAEEVQVMPAAGSQAAEGQTAAGSTSVSDPTLAAGAIQQWTPLEKCVIDFFRERKEMLNGVMKHLEAEPSEYKEASELMAPSGQASHRKGIAFLFLYDWSTGIKYKLMTEPEPVSMSWIDFLGVVYRVFTQENQEKTASVATSQQEQKGEENEGLEEEFKRVDPGMENQEEAHPEDDHEADPDMCGGDRPEPNGPDREREAGMGETEPDREENSNPGEQEESGQGLESSPDTEIPGQDNIMNHPEYLPLEMQQEKEQEDVEISEAIIPSRKELRKEARERAQEIIETFQLWDGQDMPAEEVDRAKVVAERILVICDQLLAAAERKWIKVD